MQALRVWLPLRWVMLAAVIALLVWTASAGLFLIAWVVAMVACIAYATVELIIKGHFVPLIAGVRCPECGRAGLRYVGCISFGDRFYTCPECGLRCKRGGSTAPSWYDASGPEDAAVFDPKAKGGPSPCSAWLPDRRDARRIVRFVVAFLAVFGWLLGCAMVGLWINTSWGPMVTIPVGLGVVVGLAREMTGKSATDRMELWDEGLDSR